VECVGSITLVIISTGFGLTMPTAFVSYAHENETHRAKAIGLANRLRKEGVDASIDAYDNHPPEGWPKWMEKQSKSDYIIVILSERYIKGFNQEDDSASGARFEGAILSSKLLQSGVSFRNIALVCFDECSNVQIPDVLVGCTRYFVDRQGEYEKLYTFVTGQPLIEKPTLGKIVIFPPHLLPSFGVDDNTFSSVCKVIWPYMEDNRRIFQDFGPNSGADNPGSSAKAVRFDLSLWYGKRDTIVCNNNIIANHIRSNIDLIPEAYLFTFEKWLSRILTPLRFMYLMTLSITVNINFQKRLFRSLGSGFLETSNH